MFKMSGHQKSNNGSWVRSDITLVGKTIIVTGANTGMGFQIANDLARRGAKIIMACRDLRKAEIAKRKVVKNSMSEMVSARKLDLSSLESVRNFAREIVENEDRLDILVNNAGIMMCPQSKSVDGFELQLVTNHLGHFLLTNLLLDLLKKSFPSRIINVSSSAQKIWTEKIYWHDLNLEDNYTPRLAYAQSKLMNVMFTKELHKRMQGTGVTAYSLHPGIVRTELARNFNIMFRSVLPFIFQCFFKSAKHGAQTAIFCAIAPEIVDYSGCYFKDCHLAEDDVNPVAQDSEQNKRLWDVSEEMVGLCRK